jgi:hypothetical protein
LLRKAPERATPLEVKTRKAKGRTPSSLSASSYSVFGVIIREHRLDNQLRTAPFCEGRRPKR